MDFGIKNNKEFRNYVNESEGKPYDYFNTFFMLITRVLSIFGINFDRDRKTAKKLFCSELVGRGLNCFCKIDVLKELKKNSFEDVTPQDISNLYNKLKTQ